MIHISVTTFINAEDVKRVRLIKMKLTQEEYAELYSLIKESWNIIRERYKNYSYSKSDLRYNALLRTQKILAYKYGKRYRANRNKLWIIVRDARRSKANPAFSNLHGVSIVNDIFDMIDNISGTKPADLESDMLELKDTVKNMSRLNEEAKTIGEKCQIIAKNLDNICQYIEGETDTMYINNENKTVAIS